MEPEEVANAGCGNLNTEQEIDDIFLALSQQVEPGGEALSGEIPNFSWNGEALMVPNFISNSCQPASIYSATSSTSSSSHILPHTAVLQILPQKQSLLLQKLLACLKRQ